MNSSSQLGTHVDAAQHPLVIDCHGHYTRAPESVGIFRRAQMERLKDPSSPAPSMEAISDDQIRQSVEQNQLRVLRERGSDVVLFSPRASGMEHHVADPATAIAWAEASNTLIHRVTALFPEHFYGVCQLPQTPNGNLEPSVEELQRCVNELGFVACNLNPDPSGGFWTSPPLTDEYWYPLYEAMVELNVPAMIHVSKSCNDSLHTLGAHYLNADTTVFMQLLEGDLFSRFPRLRLVIPHGGGAVPYHWGRYQGLAARLGRPPLEEHLMDNVFFDSCVYHQAGIDLLLDVVGPKNVLFASEMLGAVRGENPDTQAGWDDTKRYVDRSGLSAEHRRMIFEDNAKRVYPLLDDALQLHSTAGSTSAPG